MRGLITTWRPTVIGSSAASRKCGLKKESPMVARNYAAFRSELAKSMGIGRGGQKPAAPPLVERSDKPRGGHQKKIGPEAI
jgi:predicted transcriptional regulator